jgi:hypothetical protein
VNDAMLKAVRPRRRKAPALATDDGDELEVVGDGDLPQILPHDGNRLDECDPRRHGEGLLLGPPQL